MDLEKRKRVADGESDDPKRGKLQQVDDSEDAVKAPPPPADEEVEEFFAILRRIQVAVKYFQKHNAGRRDMTAATSWNPSFEPQDFDGVKETGERPEEDQSPGLDLNSDPGPDEPDVVSDPV